MNVYYAGRLIVVESNIAWALPYWRKRKQLAVFKPAKSKAHMVTVMLAERAGEPVVHTADF